VRERSRSTCRSRQTATVRWARLRGKAAATIAGAPLALCVTPPNARGQQSSFAATAFPDVLYNLSLDGKVLGLARQVRTSVSIRLDSQSACPNENESISQQRSTGSQKIMMKPRGARVPRRDSGAETSGLMAGWLMSILFMTNMPTAVNASGSTRSDRRARRESFTFFRSRDAVAPRGHELVADDDATPMPGPFQCLEHLGPV